MSMFCAKAFLLQPLLPTGDNSVRWQLKVHLPRASKHDIAVSLMLVSSHVAAEPFENRDELILFASVSCVQRLPSRQRICQNFSGRMTVVVTIVV